MELWTLIFVLVVVGVVMYLVNTRIPMDSAIKQLLNIAVILFLILWLAINVFHLTLPGLRL